MKKILQQYIILILALTVSFTGLGVTIINYCCNSCQEQTLFIFDELCCMQEHHLLEEDDHSCCISDVVECEDNIDSAVKYDEDSCTAHRLSIDLEASFFRPNLQAIYTWIPDNNLFNKFDLSTLTNDTSSDWIYLIESPPKLLPRDYLSFIQILII